MKKEVIYIVIAGITLFVSCARNTSDQINKANDIAIVDLYARFPELKGNKANPTSFYKLVRSVKNGLRNFEVQLYSTPPQKDKDIQEILIIKNNLGKSYAIPFFSNTHKDFWNFQFENHSQPVNLTFDKELLRALDSLQLNDTIGTAQDVIFEIFNSVLHLRFFNKYEIIDIIPIILNDPDEPNHPDWYSCEDFCSDRIKKSRVKIIESIDLSENQYNWFDVKRKRIYQFDFPQFKKIDNMNLRIYRVGCECQYIGISL